MAEREDVPKEGEVAMSTMSVGEFHRDVCNAMQQADTGPVFIHDRGEPAFVFLTVADYRRLGGDGDVLLERLTMADEAVDGFDPPRLDLRLQMPGF